MKQPNRRQFLQTSLTTLLLSKQVFSAEPQPFRFGMVTDAHYADADARGSRHYRQSLAKMRECVQFMNEQQVAFLIELGDLKDENNPPKEDETLRFLDTIETEFATFNGPRYHVLGNHDVDSISKPQFLNRVTNSGIEQDRSYYSFDRNGTHFVVLDATFNGDGTDYDHGKFDWTDANIPISEMEWLKDDLSKTENRVVVFVHQLLDGEGDVYINNAAEVRSILEGSKKVAAVFQGHHHAGQYNEINGIHYYTLKAVVEGDGEDNNSYAIAEVQQDRINITGYRKAVSKELS